MNVLEVINISDNYDDIQYYLNHATILEYLTGYIAKESESNFIYRIKYKNVQKPLFTRFVKEVCGEIDYLNQGLWAYWHRHTKNFINHNLNLNDSVIVKDVIISGIMETGTESMFDLVIEVHGKIIQYW